MDFLPFAEGKLRQEVGITEGTEAFWPRFGCVTPRICQFKEFFPSLPYPEAALAYPISSTFPAGLPAVPGETLAVGSWGGETSLQHNPCFEISWLSFAEEGYKYCSQDKHSPCLRANEPNSCSEPVHL